MYSLDGAGKLRFARHLPEMGVNQLAVFADRLLAYTSAGARLYQVGLDNKPLSQARLNMDPGTTTSCEDYEMSQADYRWLPAQKRLLNNLGVRMRVLDEQYKILADWEGEEYFDKDVADKVLRRKLRGYAVSPDGTRIAQLETSSYFARAGYKDKEIVDVHLVVARFGRQAAARIQRHRQRRRSRCEAAVAGRLCGADPCTPPIC